MKQKQIVICLVLTLILCNIACSCSRQSTESAEQNDAKEISATPSTAKEPMASITHAPAATPEIAQQSTSMETIASEPCYEPDLFPEIEPIDEPIVSQKNCNHEQLSLLVAQKSACEEEVDGKYICNSCGSFLHDASLDAEGHYWKYESTNEGHQKICAACQKEETVEPHVMDEKGHCIYCGYGCQHEMMHTVVEPSCASPGYTEHKCSVCGYFYKDERIVPKGHIYISGDHKENNCTENGWIDYCCTVCGDHMMIELPAFGHHAIIDFEIPATCQTTGLSQGSHCSICGETIESQQILPTKDHQYIDGSCVWCGQPMPTGHVSFDGENELPEIPG